MKLYQLYRTQRHAAQIARDAQASFAEQVAIYRRLAKTLGDFAAHDAVMAEALRPIVAANEVRDALEARLPVYAELVRQVREMSAHLEGIGERL